MSDTLLICSFFSKSKCEMFQVLDQLLYSAVYNEPSYISWNEIQTTKDQSTNLSHMNHRLWSFQWSTNWKIVDVSVETDIIVLNFHWVTGKQRENHKPNWTICCFFPYFCSKEQTLTSDFITTSLSANLIPANPLISSWCHHITSQTLFFQSALHTSHTKYTCGPTKWISHVTQQILRFLNY